MRPRVLIAYEQRLLREALFRLLEPEFDVVAQAADAKALLSEAAALRPDVAVIEDAMPRQNGVHSIRQFAQALPRVRVVLLTDCEDAQAATEAVRAGASGYLLKTSAASELVQAIRDVSRGQTYMTPALSRGLFDLVRHPVRLAGQTADLSPRQREVLRLLADGRTMKEIGRVLAIKPRTVAFHKYDMMNQLGIRSSAELVRFAVEQRILTGGRPIHNR